MTKWNFVGLALCQNSRMVQTTILSRNVRQIFFQGHKRSSNTLDWDVIRWLFELKNVYNTNPYNLTCLFVCYFILYFILLVFRYVCIPDYYLVNNTNKKMNLIRSPASSVYTRTAFVYHSWTRLTIYLRSFISPCSIHIRFHRSYCAIYLFSQRMVQAISICLFPSYLLLKPHLTHSFLIIYSLVFPLSPCLKHYYFSLHSSFVSFSCHRYPKFRTAVHYRILKEKKQYRSTFGFFLANPFVVSSSLWKQSGNLLCLCLTKKNDLK